RKPYHSKLTKRRIGERANRRSRRFPVSQLLCFVAINKRRGEFLISHVSGLSRKCRIGFLAVSPSRRFVRHCHWRVFRVGKRPQSIFHISFSIPSAPREPLISTTRFGSRVASSRYASRTLS